MPDRHIVVAEWADIERAPEADDRAKQRVATIFTEQSWDHVVWVPAWLLDEKRVGTVQGSDHLAAGTVEDYSEKAWRLNQRHLTQTAWEDPREFLPKSQVVVFERADGIEAIATPQRGLDAFERGGCDV